jgi:hypothetical protein
MGVSSEPLTTGGGWDYQNPGHMWRVADVKAIVNGSGNTTDCTVSAIHPSGMATGYCVTNNNSAY